MLRFSKKVEYALIAMVEMAEQEPSELVTAREISRRYNIPNEILGKILQKLTRQGLLKSVQGVRGGYTLERRPQTITIREVVEAVDGPMSLVACSTDANCECEQLVFCNIRYPMHIIESELVRFFNSITLRQLMGRRDGSAAGFVGPETLQDFQAQSGFDEEKT